MTDVKLRTINITLEDLSNDTLSESEELNSLNDVLNKAEVSTSIENNGIRFYEFWGQPCCDKGTDYLIIEHSEMIDITIKIETLPEKITAENIVNILNDNLYVKKTLSKSFPRKHARSEEDVETFELDLKVEFRNPKLNGNVFTTMACWEENN